MTAPKIDDGGPAFPLVAEKHDDAINTGMSLRDYFATHASDEDIDYLRVKVKEQREIASDGSGGHYETFRLPSNWRQLARYMHADLMLAARKARL